MTGIELQFLHFELEVKTLAEFKFNERTVPFRHLSIPLIFSSNFSFPL